MQNRNSNNNNSNSNSIRTKKRPSNQATGSFSQGGRQGGQTKKPVRKSNIDISLLSKKALPLEEINYETNNTFEDLKIDKRILANLSAKGYTQPTEIQDKVIQILISGKDVLGIARTGTGKTAAFLVPMIHNIINRDTPFSTLILAPTRELALQIHDEFKTLNKGLNITSACFIGGTNVNKDVLKAKAKPTVVIATPGRLLDMWDRRVLNLRTFQHLILDEFDKMLDMGFVKDVRKIVEYMQSREQTALFSATLDNSQRIIIGELLKDPIEVKVSSGEASSDHVEQETIKVSEDQDKMDVLIKMLNQNDFVKVIVFAETKRWVDRINIKLRKSGIKSDVIHGNKSQNYRQNALDGFKQGKVTVLIATDIAARGIDVSDITHVINYQLPSTMDNYIHRIGRTGRAGKVGKAFTFIN